MTSRRNGDGGWRIGSSGRDILAQSTTLIARARFPFFLSFARELLDWGLTSSETTGPSSTVDWLIPRGYGIVDFKPKSLIFCLLQK